MADSRNYIKNLLCDMAGSDKTGIKILLSQNAVNYLGNFVVNILRYFFMGKKELPHIMNNIKQTKDIPNLADLLLEDAFISLKNYKTDKNTGTILQYYTKVKTDVNAFAIGFIESLLKDILYTTFEHITCKDAIIYSMQYTSLKIIKKYIENDTEIYTLYKLVSKKRDDTSLENICRTIDNLYDVRTAMHKKDEKYKNTLAKNIGTPVYNPAHATLIANYLGRAIPMLEGPVNTHYFKSVAFTKHILILETDGKNVDADPKIISNILNTLENTSTFIDFFFYDNNTPNILDQQLKKGLLDKIWVTARVHVHTQILPRLKTKSTQNPHINLYIHLNILYHQNNDITFPPKLLTSLKNLRKALQNSKAFCKYILKILFHDSLKKEFDCILDSNISIPLYKNIVRNFYNKSINNYRSDIIVLEQVLQNNFNIYDLQSLMILSKFVVLTSFSVYKMSLLFSSYQNSLYQPSESFSCISYSGTFDSYFLCEALTYLNFTIV